MEKSKKAGTLMKKRISYLQWGKMVAFLFVLSGMFGIFGNPSIGNLAAQEAPPSDTTAVKLPPEVEEEVKKAVAAFNKTDFPGALEVLKQVYAKNPNLAPPRIVMAQWFAQANLGEAVRANLEMATEETPNDPEAYLLLGEILMRQRYLTAAELLFSNGETKLHEYNANPDRRKQMIIAFLRNQIVLAEARNRWPEMIAAVDNSIQFNGETPLLARQKGIALFQAKREAEAFELFKRADALKAQDKDDNGLPAEAAMAQLYQARGDSENAKRYLAEALKKYPKSKEVVVLSIQSRMNDNQLEEAQKLADRLLAENADWQPAKRLRATIALYLNDYVGAERLFQELILVAPSDEQIANGLALAQCEQGDQTKLQRALEYARANVQKNQQNSDYWATLGWVLFKANQIQPAAQALKQASATGRVNAATAYYMARLALQSNQPDEAKKLLEAAAASPSPFAKRRDAMKLLADLSK